MTTLAEHLKGYTLKDRRAKKLVANADKARKQADELYNLLNEADKLFKDVADGHDFYFFLEANYKNFAESIPIVFVRKCDVPNEEYTIFIEVDKLNNSNKGLLGILTLGKDGKIDFKLESLQGVTMQFSQLMLIEKYFKEWVNKVFQTSQAV